MNIFQIFKKKLTANCGHVTKEKNTIIVFGEKINITLSLENGKTEYCHKCIEKMAIRCAWCGHSILIGDPITLYSPRNKDFKIPPYATIFNKEPLQLVGCLRWDCAETTAPRYAAPTHGPVQHDRAQGATIRTG